MSKILKGLFLGRMRMPTIISILKIDPRIAVCTNLGASSIIIISGLIGRIINNNIDYFVLVIMG